MKRIFLLLLVIAASTQLKAQQLTFRPADSLLFKAPKSWDIFKSKQGDSILLKGFSNLPKSNSLAMLQGLKGNYKRVDPAYGNIPVAKLQVQIECP